MSTKKRHRRSIASLLRTMQQAVFDRAVYDLKRDGVYLVVLRGAFIKSFEFAYYSSKIRSDRTKESAFYLVSGLRGICEDLISLTYLRQLGKTDRDDVVWLLMDGQLEAALHSQANFFGAARPFQPVLGPKGASDKVARRDRLQAIGKKSGLWSGRSLPTVQAMAEVVGLRTIYEFFYRVTSGTVHFNPARILRTGWGDTFTGKLSTTNFVHYYLSFSQDYGVYLFLEFCRGFAVELSLDEQFTATLEELERALNDLLRWPEPVTFEEMNIKGPSDIERILARAMNDIADEEGTNSRDPA